MIDLIKRTWNLFKVARAVKEVRTSTDEEKRERARHYLMELLGQSRGLPTKVGQFMTMDSGSSELKTTLQESVPSLPFNEVEGILNRLYLPTYKDIFKFVEPEARVASLGEVHRARLRDGKDVAVKIRYPEVDRFVKAEMQLLGLMPGVGPVKRWGFDMGGYQSTFKNHFEMELDYLTEAKVQEEYGRKNTTPGMVVPEIFHDLCRPETLVQSFEEGLSVEQAESASVELRKQWANILLEHYLTMLFRTGLVHSDPNPANFAFREGLSPQVVLYDYGSVLRLSDKERQVLLRTILAVRNREQIDPMACLAGLGFDSEKMKDIRPVLPALLKVLFEPFIENQPFDITRWNMSARVDALLGELKWWFRSSAPPHLIFLMRTLHGLSQLLIRLDVRLSWANVLDKTCNDLYASAESVALPEMAPSSGDPQNFRSLAQYLKVNVYRNGSTSVRLAMPARVVDELEEVIDASVMEAIRRDQIDLDAIKRKAQRSGYLPQTLFELKDGEKEIKVFLE